MCRRPKNREEGFRLGERLRRLFKRTTNGGPVTNATVEVLVYQNPFQHWYRPRVNSLALRRPVRLQRIVTWVRKGSHQTRNPKTDAFGASTLTALATTNRTWVSIEARVTDASDGNHSQRHRRVTCQRYYIYPYKRNLYRPQDKVSIDLRSRANEQLMEVEGRVKVTRDRWFEVWLDQRARGKGEELKSCEGRTALPPGPKSSGEPGNSNSRVMSMTTSSLTVKTDAEGAAQLNFVPERDGYYRIAWNSQDKGSSPIQAEATVRVATGTTTDLGYRSGGVEIIVDQDTIQPGQKAPVMLQAFTQDRYVLFSVEGEDLYSYQLGISQHGDCSSRDRRKVCSQYLLECSPGQ
jgi:hypothetical protein